MAKISLNLADEAAAIAQLVGVNVDEIKDKSDVRLVLAAEVANQYARIDEILAEIIVRYFFVIEPDVLHFEKAWKTDKFKIFVHQVLDAGTNIRSLDGLRQFKDDADTAYRYLRDRLYGPARRAD